MRALRTMGGRRGGRRDLTPAPHSSEDGDSRKHQEEDAEHDGRAC